MVDISPENFSVKTMSNKDFTRFSEFIQGKYGIKLPAAKKTMLESRLLKRLRNLGINSFNEYYDYVFSTKGKTGEMVHMIDEVTTNKTEFFRERGCFDYMLEKALPEFVDIHGAGNPLKKFKVWSAGCASGEEPYTLAMVLLKFHKRCPEFHFSILATDISTKMLNAAIRAVYDQEKIDLVPSVEKKKYFMMSKRRERRLVRIVPELRSIVNFGRLNLMDEDYGIKEPMDVILCRNVMIYFDRSTQEKILAHLCRHLTRGGYIILGQSEMIMNMNLPLVQVAPMVYRKEE